MLNFSTITQQNVDLLRLAGVPVINTELATRELRKELTKDNSLELCLERERFKGFVRERNSEISPPDFITISYISLTMEGSSSATTSLEIVVSSQS
jgi:hypothetical protein